MTRVVVLDYGFGNLRSAERALERAGAEVEVTAAHRAAVEADGLVVPGVGAFAACMAGLQAVGGDKIIDERLSDGRPVLGICVGMQVLFDRGGEHDVSAEGCGRWPGAVERVRAQVLPHMGWNRVEPPDGTTLFAGISAGTHFYFVHSFAVRAWESDSGLPTWCEHGEPFVAAAEDGPLAATQFHPEKSGEPGAALLRNWLDSVASGSVR